MKKKVLPMFLTLALCLSLVPAALAADKTTVTDPESGVTLTLSQPYLEVHQETRLFGVTISFNEETRDYNKETRDVYTIPAGTTITVPNVEGDFTTTREDDDGEEMTVIWYPDEYGWKAITVAEVVESSPNQENTWGMEYEEGDDDEDYDYYEEPSDFVPLWERTTQIEFEDDHVTLSEPGVYSVIFGCDGFCKYGGTVGYFGISFRVAGETAGQEEAAAPAITSSGIAPEAKGTAKASTQTVVVDGKAMTFDMYALIGQGGETNYVKLQDMAYLLKGTKAKFSVGWNPDTEMITLTSGGDIDAGFVPSTPYSGDQAYQRREGATVINGTAYQMAAFTLQNGSYTYFKLRDLGKALGFNVGWDKVNEKVYIETDQPYTDAN